MTDRLHILGEGEKMSMEIEERIKSLEVALNNETQERNFYMKHREKTSNPIGKLIFATLANDESEHYQRIFQLHATLANDESEHYQRIFQLHEKLKEEGKWPETIPLTIKGTEIKSVLQREIDAVEQLPEMDKDELEAVKIALDYEAEGVRFYENLRDNVDDPLEKEFYGMIASMEREHFLSLQDVYEHFRDLEGRDLTEEKPHFDGR
jgi:rubrerythrin